eukprot:scaffold3.g6370.t1
MGTVLHEKPAAEGSAAAAKRQKVEAAAKAGPIIRPGLLSEESRAALRAQYVAAAPYPHCVIAALADPAKLRAVREEIIENVQATYKARGREGAEQETDLFKMLQTGDLANLDALDPEAVAKLPTVRELRDALYSQEFRDFVSKVTGCGPLSDKTDCACNVHAQGGHLLCHDDVIGDRRVSYIIYLTDPDEPWTAEDGGALELYPTDPKHPNAPATTPTAFHLPAWNAMGMFMVQPGFSFHAIQEGWFHSNEPPKDAYLATRSQLQMHAGEDAVRAFDAFSGEGAPGGPLTEADASFLLKWVNPAYLSEDAWHKVAARFKEDGSVQLQNFLQPSLAAKVAAACAAADAADGLGGGRRPLYEAGLGGGWAPLGPPHKQRYLRYAAGAAGADPEGPGALLAGLQAQLFGSTPFARLLAQLTTLGLRGHKGEVRRFRPGLDYTVAHFGVLTKDPQLDAVLCFVDDGEEDAREAWDGGEVGGYEAFVLADESNEAAEVYQRQAEDDDESGVLNVSPAANTLSLVLRDEGLMKFVKFLSYQAPSSRFDISVTYEPEEDSDEEEEEEGGKEGAAAAPAPAEEAK